MKSFNFKEEDTEGLLTLEAIRNAAKFNRWMYDQVAPYLIGDILEIGSGIGNISDFFIQHNAKITLSDVRESYCKVLSTRFPIYTQANPVKHIDLVATDFESRYSDLLEKFDAVFALNVIEHIEQDQLALKNLNLLLKPKGKVVILVPSHPKLYNRIDKNLHHFRRYDSQQLENKIITAGFSIDKTSGFNALGILAWWISGNLFQSTQIRNSQMHFYDRLVPLAKLIDKIFMKRIGLSIITYATTLK